MDDSGHRENGRHRPDMYRAPQSQWLMQQPQSMKHIMSIMAERDAAIQERNMAVSEKKKALEERDLAIMQRDAAIQERDNAVMERDNAIAALQARQIPMNSIGSCPPGCQISRGVKHMHNLQHHLQHTSDMGEASCDSRDVQVHDALPLTSVSSDSPKPRKVKRGKETGQMSPNKKPSKSKYKAKKGEDLNKMMFHKSPEWKEIHDMDDSDDYNEQLGESKSGWRGSDLGLNHVAFDESTMAPPVCSCTGVYRQCYKWGNGGWQSACCTTTLSMYPLPSVPNKRHGRVGGRKMSGSAFNKLLSRLAADGHDLSTPIDLKDHWAKHGTNRYITIR